MNPHLHPFWEGFGSDRSTLVVFEHGTCVILDQPTPDPAARALDLMWRLGPVHVGSAAGDFGVIPIDLDDGRCLGWLVTSHWDEIVTFLPSERGPAVDREDPSWQIRVGLIGRGLRQKDAEALRVTWIDHRVPRSRDALVAAIDAGYRAELLPFFGVTDDPGRAVMSQWWPSPFVVDGQRYATAEHFMMAEKARCFGDEATREAILRSTDPATAKALGRRVTPFAEEVWAAQRFDVVVRGNLAKFGQDPGLLALLHATWPAVPVEASPYDRIWGIGLADDESAARDPRAWRGDNLLGFALAEARRRLMHRRGLPHGIPAKQ